MSTNEMISKIEALKEWEALAAEAAAEIESLKDAIKAEMTARGVEELQAGQEAGGPQLIVLDRASLIRLWFIPGASFSANLESNSPKRKLSKAPRASLTCTDRSIW